jgi:hypothetical protein
MEDGVLRSFLRAVFVEDEYHAGLPGSVRARDARYAVQSTRLAAQYNAWREVSGLGAVSGKRFTMRMLAHGAAYGIERERTAQCTNFVLDVPRMRAALGGGVG